MLCLFRRLWIACLMLCITTFCVHAQNAITGTVKDVAGEPIIGANILVKGTTNNGEGYKVTSYYDERRCGAVG